MPVSLASDQPLLPLPMLSFFRSIRRSLISEGKTVRYLKYAVGEFLLIVAGILVALQIQNWNEGRLERVKEVEYLRNLLVEMKEAKAEFDHDQERYRAIIAASESLLPQFENRTASDSEIIDFIQLAASGTVLYFPPDAVLEDLISSGNLQLLSSSDLRFALNNYSREKDRLRYIEDNRIQRNTEQLQPFLKSRLNLYKPAQRPGTVDRLLSSQEFENHIFQLHGSMQYSYTIWRKMLETALDGVIEILEADPRSRAQ